MPEILRNLRIGDPPMPQLPVMEVAQWKEVESREWKRQKEKGNRKK
jgi:hypothetical protein